MNWCWIWVKHACYQQLNVMNQRLAKFAVHFINELLVWVLHHVSVRVTLCMILYLEYNVWVCRKHHLSCSWKELELKLHDKNYLLMNRRKMEKLKTCILYLVQPFPKQLWPCKGWLLSAALAPDHSDAVCWFPFRCYLKIFKYPEVLQPHLHPVPGCHALWTDVFAGKGRAVAALSINLLTANGKQERFCWCLKCFSCYEQWWHIEEQELSDTIFFFQSASLIGTLLCYLFFSRLMLSFSMSSPAVLNMQRIENVIRMMAPFILHTFFALQWGEVQQQQSYWSCLKRDFASLHIPNNHKIGL